MTYLGIQFYLMERRWEGNGRARITVVAAPGDTVWRFKIDEEQRTVITTYSDGGLKVSAIDERTVLWSLPRVSVSLDLLLWLLVNNFGLIVM